MERGRKAGKQGKIHGVKDDWNETQLCEVARKAAEDEEWKRGWWGTSRDGWRSEVAEAEMKYWSVEARATPAADPPLSTIFRQSLAVVNAAEIPTDFARSFANTFIARYSRSILSFLSAVIILINNKTNRNERTKMFNLIFMVIWLHKIIKSFIFIDNVSNNNYIYNPLYKKYTCMYSWNWKWL